MLALSFLLLTPFRIVSLFSYPILIWVIKHRYGVKGGFKFWILVFVSLFSCFMSLLLQFSDVSLYFLNSSLSLYFVLFGLYLFFIRSIENKALLNEHLDRFFIISTVGLIVCDVLGGIQFLLSRHPDSFIGFYGRNGLSNHGLSILNLLFAVYWFSRCKLVSIFLFVSAILGFFGSALIVFFVSLGCTILVKSKNFILGLVLASFFIFVVLFSFQSSNSEQIRYYRLCIETAINPDLPSLGKIQSWNNYFSAEDVGLFFGYGPGKYNSRVSFFLSGDSSMLHSYRVFNRIAERDIFTLWNADISATPFKDGTMNQPFGTWLALLSEYGLIFTVLILVFLLFELRRVDNFHSLFVLLFTCGLFFVDNILEYPEMMIPLGLFYLTSVKSD